MFTVGIKAILRKSITAINVCVIPHFLAISTAADNDYEDITGAGQIATAIYDYQGGTYSHSSP